MADSAADRIRLALTALNATPQEGVAAARWELAKAMFDKDQDGKISLAEATPEVAAADLGANPETGRPMQDDAAAALGITGLQKTQLQKTLQEREEEKNGIRPVPTTEDMKRALEKYNAGAKETDTEYDAAQQTRTWQDISQELDRLAPSPHLDQVRAIMEQQTSPPPAGISPSEAIGQLVRNQSGSSYTPPWLGKPNQR